MTFERVHQIWDIYDGVRTGVADLNGAPHYFSSQFDDCDPDHLDSFKLYPVDDEFMRRAQRHWTIFRDWEHQFHSGEAEQKTHPGLGGINAEYDELASWLDHEVKRLSALPMHYAANFRALPSQGALPRDMLPQLEVAWSALPA